MIWVYLLGLLPAAFLCFFSAAAICALSHSSKDDYKLFWLAAGCTLVWPFTLMLVFILACVFIFGPTVEKAYYQSRLGKELYQQMRDKIAQDYMRMDEIDRQFMFNDKLTDFELDELELELNELMNKDEADYFREFLNKKSG